MIKAIIFDFDGTIIDTETAWYHAFRDAYQEHGVELTLEQYSGCIGTSLHTFNPYEYLISDLGLQLDPQQFRSEIRGRHAALMERETVREGIIDYLKLAKASGLRIGLATSSERSWIDRHLEQLGLSGYFECIRTADDVEKVKPDPALYAETLRGLGVAAHEAIAVEDSPNGARAAAAAGIPCIVVPNGLTRLLAFDQSKLYYAAESLADIRFELVAAGLLPCQAVGRQASPAS